MDASYPFGRQRKLISFNAIDDCSRYVVVKLYKHEDAKSAIDFVKHLIQKVPFRIERIRVDNRYGKDFKNFCNSIGTDFVTLVMNQLHVIDMKTYVIIGLVCMILLIMAIVAGVIRWMAEVLCVFGEVAGI